VDFRAICDEPIAVFLDDRSKLVTQDSSLPIEVAERFVEHNPVEGLQWDNSSDYLKVELAAGARAACISCSYYTGNFAITTKADMTLMTQADVYCQQAIRDVILSEFADLGFFGEETGKV